jgi:hypothetical protein
LIEAAAAGQNVSIDGNLVTNIQVGNPGVNVCQATATAFNCFQPIEENGVPVVGAGGSGSFTTLTVSTLATMPAGSLGSPGLTLTGAGGYGFFTDSGGFFAFTAPSGNAPAMAFDRAGATLANGSNVLNLAGFGNDNAGTPVWTEWGSLTFQALTTTGGAADQGSVNIGVDNGGAIYSAVKIKPSGTAIYATAGTGALAQTALFNSTGIYVGSAGTVQVSDVSGNSFYPTIAAHDAVISEGGSSASVGAAGGTNCVLTWTASTADPTCSQAPTLATSLTAPSLISTGGVFLHGYAIATLPATCTAGELAFVTNGVASPTYGVTPSTTGAVADKVFCVGSAWVYGMLDAPANDNEALAEEAA